MLAQIYRAGFTLAMLAAAAHTMGAGRKWS